jgi:hypothetical protein
VIRSLRFRLATTFLVGVGVGGLQACVAWLLAMGLGY